MQPHTALDPALRDLVRTAPFPDRGWLPAQDEIEAHELDQFDALCNDSQARLVVVERGGRLVAAAAVSLLEWDTRVLGLTSSRARLWFTEDLRSGEAIGWLRQIREAACELGAELLDLKIDARAAFLGAPLEMAGFQLRDGLVDFVAPTGGSDQDDGYHIRAARPDDRRTLMALTVEAFADPRSSANRFVVDPILGPAKAASVYTAWMEHLLDGRAIVMVSEDAGAIAGYITIEMLDRRRQSAQTVADVALNAVAAHARGKGHYRALVRAAFRCARKGGCALIHVRTQMTALPVHATWSSRGARLVKSLYSFHATPQWRH
jgi:GNAT superfamily N-acetyltransferase